jgi:RHS repeat-associated protein
MQMPGRKFSNGGGYRYGFNGKENDKEVKGEGNSYDFGARIYDPRLGRWLSTDIITKPFITPYNYSSNDPVNYLDPNGQDNIHFFYVITRTYLNGKLYLAKTSKFSVVEKNDEPNVFIHHKVELRYDGIGGAGELTKQIDTRFYPDVPGESSGLTKSYWGLIKDDDRKTLIKFIDEYGLSKQDVDNQDGSSRHAEITKEGTPLTDRVKKAQWWGGVFASKKNMEEEDAVESAKMTVILTGLSFVLPELALARFEGGMWLGGVAALGEDGATIKSASNLVSKKGWFDVIVHGDKYYEGIAFNLGGPNPVSVQEVYNLMLQNGYKQGTSIRLISCNSGKGVAQELSNLAGAKVIAPKALTKVNDAGKLITSDGSKYQVFNPN